LTVIANVAVTLTSTNVHGTCALVAQGGASCPADDDDKRHHKDKDKNKDNSKDDNKDHN
jgi:hypothetical protein